MPPGAMRLVYGKRTADNKTRPSHRGLWGTAAVQRVLLLLRALGKRLS
jgi:hypothetical protein